MSTFLTRIAATDAGRLPRSAGQPASGWAFTGLAVTSFGGPLALAALYAPAGLGGASAAAGLAMAGAVALFAVPLVIWLRYARRVNGAGGLYSFVEAAAGRRVALVQAGLWIVSYLLYLLYTTAQIVYDTLPAVLPAERRYQPVLEIAIPVALAGVMIAGRRAALLVTGVLAAGQIVLAAALGGVTLAHLPVPVSSFAGPAPAGALASAAGQTSLLYICGSLPLFLGGELARPARTIRRGLTAAWLVTAVVVTAAVAPLAAAPAFTRAPIPGMAVAERFAGHGFAVAVGLGVAVSVAGVMLAEYFALSPAHQHRHLVAPASGHHRPRRRTGPVRAGHAHQPGPDLQLPDQAVADRALAQPADRLRGVPPVRRAAARPPPARLGADGGRHRVRALRPLGHHPAFRNLTDTAGRDASRTTTHKETDR